MPDDHILHNRRSALFTALAVSGVAAATILDAHASPLSLGSAAGAAEAPGDFDFLVGRWNVRHSKLRKRLAGSTDWDDFAGTCVNWPLLGGQGNVDDNLLHTPQGAYRGVGVRAFDPVAGAWSIWWLDSRDPGRMDVPVRGGFRDGVGTFVADDLFEDRPIRMRFTWSKITPTTAHWEQAFSPDGGASWEVNWRMDFARQ
ncbi:MAG: hypothetical protein JWN66_3812 [Sphingomonas bacterium]|nr:hypothetical protein [Sphingomonas bacterium]